MRPRRWTALIETGLVGIGAAVMMMLPQQAAQSTPQPTTVSITFDDTYADTMPGLDAMKARGIPGTLYVNSQRVGFNSQFMTRTQLRSYADVGFEIGGHTLNHEDLTTLSPEVAQANICQDRANLANLGYRPTSFAYPFGAENLNIQQMAADCGYNSGRMISDLKSPASCSLCATAEPLPPVNRYAIRTPASVRSSFSLAQVESLVTQAENDTGGWVPLVFHHICDGCSSNSISLRDFTAFLDWLQDRPSSTVIRTVNSVIGGTYTPPDDDNPVPDDDLVLIGSRQHVLTAVNAYRCNDCMIEYTTVAGTTSGANPYGTEVSVVGGVVQQMQTGVGNMAIPAGAGNYVLSGHGESGTWLRTNAPVGAHVALHAAGTPPPPPPPPPPTCPSGQVTIGSQMYAVSGVDIARKANFLVVYTPTFGALTGTNEFGFEAEVVGGKVTKIANGVGNMTIPPNGCVLSGHGDARTWLQANAVVGASVN